KQTAQEASKFGITCNLAEGQEDIKPGINITNYEKIHKFDTDSFSGVVLDESSILKSYAGKTTKDLQERFAYTPYKLCCTATPSPNDYTE
ncbi:helicase, partial [[Clostridium] innocuum]|nr:helicase [[Clostridium] innocuum]